ncbi:conserved hypothetical protein [Mesorhizobium plurifarium]|uniref:Uncharacterized protein n=1 Tax=Mesorhizobium plurifarium TaxID=69974 RepID=A0A090G3F9_MESPL|nr:conserved hypothetical protein [Mesorhizobium plurifarium]
MQTHETPLEMAERHVREGAERIARQRALIDRMAERGQLSDEAQLFLDQLQAAQREHTAHLDRLRGE